MINSLDLLRGAVCLKGGVHRGKGLWRSFPIELEIEVNLSSAAA